MSAHLPTHAVMPAQAGIQLLGRRKLDSGLRRNDGGLADLVFWEKTPHLSVMPAQAGIQLLGCQSWIPAFAGMTDVGDGSGGGLH
jgi:hypothetical protein